MIATRSLAVLGSTGSIGRQALDVAARQRDRVRVSGLAAARSLDLLCEQARRWKPRWLALERPEDERAARSALATACPGAAIGVGKGSAARLAAECDADVVLNGIVGAQGLAASLETLRAGRRLALANKETLVVGGPWCAKPSHACPAQS
jgi:1-deoxy-D-xylulose-5-phosphate reductoisomerase